LVVALDDPMRVGRYARATRKTRAAGAALWTIGLLAPSAVVVPRYDVIGAIPIDPDAVAIGIFDTRAGLAQVERAVVLTLAGHGKGIATAVAVAEVGALLAIRQGSL